MIGCAGGRKGVCLNYLINLLPSGFPKAISSPRQT